MWIIAGPNGAGKSTLTRHGVIREVSGQNLRELNADQRAHSRAATEGDPLLIAYKDQSGRIVLLEPGLIQVIDDVLLPFT